MKLSGLHLLLTYQCTFECEHCFVWGSPWQSGVMNLAQLHEILRQAREMEGLDWIYFEGGEPFLYYPILLRGVQMATAMGFHIGIVSNAYWATTEADALSWLKPFADLIEDLTISSDLYHYSETNSDLTLNAAAAAAAGAPVLSSSLSAWSCSCCHRVEHASTDLSPTASSTLKQPSRPSSSSP